MLNLKQRRIELGLTMLDVAKLVGVSEATISRYESGNIKNMRSDRIEKYAKALNVSPSDFLEINEDTIMQTKEKINFNYAENSKIRKIPIFKTVSAGFGAYADDKIIGYEPVLIESDYDAENTLAIVVQGDSMYPKIENGDIIIVLKQECFENGDIIVAIPNDGTDNGYVKRAFCTDNELILESINNSYPPMRYTREEMNQIHIVGIVKKIIKSI